MLKVRLFYPRSASQFASLPRRRRDVFMFSFHTKARTGLFQKSEREFKESRAPRLINRGRVPTSDAFKYELEHMLDRTGDRIQCNTSRLATIRTRATWFRTGGNPLVLPAVPYILTSEFQHARARCGLGFGFLFGRGRVLLRLPWSRSYDCGRVSRGNGG
jgi:hypothetical protein